MDTLAIALLLGAVIAGGFASFAIVATTLGVDSRPGFDGRRTSSR